MTTHVSMGELASPHVFSKFELNFGACAGKPAHCCGVFMGRRDKPGDDDVFLPDRSAVAVGLASDSQRAPTSDS